MVVGLWQAILLLVVQDNTSQDDTASYVTYPKYNGYEVEVYIDKENSRKLRQE